MTELIEKTRGTARQRAVVLVIALVIGGVWMNSGADGVASLILLGGVFWVSRWLGPGRGMCQHLRTETPHFGPTDHERFYDPGYSVYAENLFHKTSHSK